MLYTYNDNLPYSGYLKKLSSDVNSGKDVITYEIESSTREIVTSLDYLSEQNIELKQEFSSGIDELSMNIQNVSGAINDLQATFFWGFNAILSRLGRMADTLEDLLATAKSPMKTQAYEFFNDARNAFNRNHNREALELIEKAIFGDHISTGYKLDWRFHYLKASILIGTVANPELLDLEKSKKSYLIASNYASSEKDYNGTALALLGASWACYCQGQIKKALDLCEHALKFRASFGEALFQSAKIHMALNITNDGFLRLEAALEKDPKYILKAAGDEDFKKHGDLFKDWTKKYQSIKQKELLSVYKELSVYPDFWIKASNKIALEKLTSTLLQNQISIFDSLCAIQNLNSVQFNNNALKPSASEASGILKIIPKALEVPQTLLAIFIIESNSWEEDDYFFEFLRLLKKLDKKETLRETLIYRKKTTGTPLEIFALCIEYFPQESSCIKGLDEILNQKSFESRRELILEFEKLKLSGRYSDSTIRKIFNSLYNKYNEWKSNIRKNQKELAYKGTEHPLSGIISVFFGSALLFAIPALIVGLLFDEFRPGTGTYAGSRLWYTAIFLSVCIIFYGKYNIRSKRLKNEKYLEKKLLDRLNCL